MEIYDFDIRTTSFYDIDIDSERYLPAPIRDIIIGDMNLKGITKKRSKGVSSGK